MRRALFSLLLLLAAALGAAKPQEPPALAPFRGEVARLLGDEERLAGEIGERRPFAARVLFELIASAEGTSGLKRAAAFARAARAAGASDALAAVPVALLALDDEERAEWRQLYADIAIPGAEGRERRLESVAARARLFGDALLEAAARRSLGAALFFGGDRAGARRAVAATLAIDEALGDGMGVAEDHRLLGEIHAAEGDSVAAERSFGLALAAAGAIGDGAGARGHRVRLAALAARLGRFDDSAEMARELLGEEETGPSDRATALEILASVEASLGRYRQSTERYAEAAEAYRAAGLEASAVAARFAMGAIESEIGRPRDGVATLEAALAEARAAGAEPALLARGRRLLGLARSDAGDLAAARRDLEAALPLADADASERAEILFHLGLNAARGGGGDEDFAEAERFLGEALRERRRQKAPFGEGLAAIELAHVKLRRGEIDEAEALAISARETASRVEAPDLRWRADAAIGNVSESRGEPGAALASYRDAIAVLESLRAGLGPGAFRSGFLDEEKSNLYRAAALIEARLGRAEAAFEIAERGKARFLRERLAAGGNHFGGAAAARVAALRERLAECSAEPEREALRAALERASAEIESASDPPVGLERIALALPERCGIVEAVSAPRGLALFLVRREGLSVRTVDEATAAEVKATVGEIWAPMRRLRTGRTDLAHLDFAARAAERLFSWIVAPFLAEIEDLDALAIVPDGALFLVPMAALVERRGRALVDPASPLSHHGAHAYFGERVALTTLFSASLLVEERRAAERDGRPPDLLAIGVKEAPGADPLPGAEAEVLRLSRVSGLSARALLGPAATEAAFRREAPGARFVHVAAHGAVDDALPLRSRLILMPDAADDGHLEAREVEEMRLAADLVTLGACDAGSGALEGGEGLAGLARSFRVAGARRVAASLWPVEDGSPIFAELYERVAGGESPMVALREARRTVLADARRRRAPECHPYFWAGVVLTGPP